MPAKTALVLSAGGMFGSYQAGAWGELSARLQPDLVVGASAGALNGWAIAGGCPPDELIRRWKDPSSSAFLKPQSPLRLWRGLFDDVSFSNHVREFFSSFAPRIPCGIAITDLIRLSARLVTSPTITWQHLAASAAIPIGLPPVRIDGRWYIDGGLLSLLPVWAAAEMGATRVVAVNALPMLPSRLLRAGARVLRLFSPRIPPSSSLELILIRPAGSLGTLKESVCWNPDNIQRWIEQGAEDARRVIQSVPAGPDFIPCVLQ
jgi:NTE family protein